MPFDCSFTKLRQTSCVHCTSRTRMGQLRAGFLKVKSLLTYSACCQLVVSYCTPSFQLTYSLVEPIVLQRKEYCVSSYKATKHRNKKALTYQPVCANTYTRRHYQRLISQCDVQCVLLKPLTLDCVYREPRRTTRQLSRRDIE
jgi:hypothetical protein